MKLSTRGRYAVMAMTELALHPQDRSIVLAEIAQRQEISLSYLEQLFGKLRRNGLVRSARGPGGGYRLSRASDSIFIADIIRAVDEPIVTKGCHHRNGKATGCQKSERHCVAHDLWEELGQKIDDYLSSVSLADVCAKNKDKDAAKAESNAHHQNDMIGRSL